MSKPAAFDVVVMAASAGGHSACRTILSGLPEYFPAPIVLSRHQRANNGQRLLAAALDRTSPLNVTPAVSGQPLRAGTAYVTPGGQHAVVDGGGRLQLADGGAAADRGGDALFDSAARHHGRRALAVILTGRLDDGAVGVRAIKRGGGRVLIQDPADAEASGMPTAALATGCVDLVLPLELMTSALVALVMAPGAAELFQTPLPAWADMAIPPGR